MPLSAGDWIRIKRVQSARNYNTVLSSKKDITNVATPAIPNTNRSHVVGSSRTRRESSKWTDYVASRAQGYVLTSEVFNTTTNLNTGATRNTLVRVNCNCGTITGANSSVLTSRTTGCINCQHLRS
jgi:hypothetical protein